MKLVLKRVTGNHQDFKKLVDILNIEQAIRNGDKNDFYMQFNSIENINHALVAYYKAKPVGCGALRAYDENSLEIKRMFTKSDFRGQGIALQILKELENWTAELGYERNILETGKMNPEAIQFYRKNDYIQIDCFGPYTNDQDSLCFEKKIN